MITIGIDIGGTSMKAVLTEPGGEVYATARRPTMADADRDATIDQLHDCIEELMDKSKSESLTVEGIGIGVPGAIDIENGVVYHPPNLPQWDEVPLGDIIHERWGMDVRLDNDANCAALGEAHYGAGRRYEDFIGLTLGTGVGSGIIIGNRIYHGERGFAGEFGHITIDYNGPLCACGNHGCVEAYIGIRYMMRDALPLLREAPASPLHKQAIEHPDDLTPEDLSRAAADGDDVSAGVLRTAGERLGIAIASTANLLDITTFIVGGGISAAGDILFDGIRSSAKARALKVHRDHLTILTAERGNDAGMLGAAALLV